ncbi:MAG TPA: hypothetical protein VK466_15800, partial [Terriglobales bacterium]|nr:hypothetical protein [Terriglobales bacterium]
IMSAAAVAAAQQVADPNFDARVESPAYGSRHPRVAIDQAHNNFHTMDGRYKPLAELLRNDGYDVAAHATTFTPSSLKGIDVLIVANALAADADGERSDSAFTNDECKTVYEWVKGGGSLFFIADHVPFGAAAAPLAARFGVRLGKGFVFDSDSNAIDGDHATFMVFSEDNKLLGDHPITRGRSAAERLHRLIAFTGESMTVPKRAVVLLRLSPTAGEAPSREDMQKLRVDNNAVQTEAKLAAAAKRWPPAGRAQAIAFQLGKGRVVINGEAGMLSAQVFVEKNANGTETISGRMGMNVPGTDDRQYALNVLHWLSGLLK